MILHIMIIVKMVKQTERRAEGRTEAIAGRTEDIKVCIKSVSLCRPSQTLLKRAIKLFIYATTTQRKEERQRQGELP